MAVILALRQYPQGGVRPPTKQHQPSRHVIADLVRNPQGGDLGDLQDYDDALHRFMDTVLKPV